MDGLSLFDSSKAGVIVKLIVGKYDSNFSILHSYSLASSLIKISCKVAF